jgi:rhodanese-related sulfurtransferase
MTHLRKLLLLAPAWMIASCAEPFSVTPPAADDTPAEESPTPVQQKPKFKKPPRMNGRGEVTSISLEQFFTLQQSGKTLIFDARPAFLYALGHIPGAVNLSKHNCDEAIFKREAEIKAALAEGKTLVVYCSSLTCPDARTVAIHLSGFGYPAAIYSGGYDGWKEAGMPTE